MSLFRTAVVLLFCISASGVQSVQAEILVGLAATLTGQFSRSGEQYRTGAEVAPGETSRQGGHVGEQVRFNPRVIDDFGRNVFRVCGRNDRQGQVMGEHLFDQWKEVERAIAHNGSPSSEGLAQINERHINVCGATDTDVPPILLSSLGNTLSIQMGMQAPPRRQSSSSFDAAMGLKLPLQIFSADDHPAYQEMGKMILSPLGYDAGIVGNGLEVIQARHVESFDLVFMDVNLQVQIGKDMALLNWLT